MTLAFWCVLAALLLPYVFSILARWGTPRREYVGDPRSFNERLSGWRRRAHYAQLNAFETFPAFAAAVIVAHLTSVAQARIDLVSAVFVAFRILHGAAYLADWPSVRSASWQAGMLCVVALFVLSAIAGS